MCGLWQKKCMAGVVQPCPNLSQAYVAGPKSMGYAVSYDMVAGGHRSCERRVWK